MFGVSDAWCAAHALSTIWTARGGWSTCKLVGRGRRGALRLCLWKRGGSWFDRLATNGRTTHDEREGDSPRWAAAGSGRQRQIQLFDDRIQVVAE